MKVRPHKFMQGPRTQKRGLCWKCDQVRTATVHGPTAAMLTLKTSLEDVSSAGDFCFTDAGKVIMACPLCGGVFACPHEVKQREPLTLSPSVVGPLEAWNPKEQVLGPCGHHFWVESGQVVDAM